jgi:xylan 1,4-beta-xylosidase
VEVLIMEYRDDEVSSPGVRVPLTVTGLPADLRHVQVEQFRVGNLERDAFRLWQNMGSPQQPTAKQLRQLEAAGNLLRDPLSAEIRPLAAGTLKQDIYLLGPGLTLVRIAW